MINHYNAMAGVRVPQGLVFDMDGTILDTRRFHMEAWRELVKRHGFPPHYYDVAEKGFGKTNWSIFHDWFREEMGKHDIEGLSVEKEVLFRELIHGHAEARPGFEELLAVARGRAIKIALATSGPRENAEFLLNELKVTYLFDAVVFGTARIRSKPHPEPFLRAAGRLGLSPRWCIGFEDSRHGFWSILRSGMKLVAIAERPEDMTHIPRWTRWGFEDFRPVVRWLSQAR